MIPSFQTKVGAQTVSPESYYFYVTASNCTTGQWNHFEIDLTDVPNYENLLADNTEFGFYTPSGSTIYLANIQVE